MNALGRMALAGMLAVGLVGAAGAQENLDQGKSATQLFNSDCSGCHKTPQGLAARVGMTGLESFLREHYTASKESAAVLAGYLRAAGNAPAPGPKTTKRKQEPKTGDKDKKDEKTGDKTDEKSADKKTDAKETKPSDKPKTDTKTDAKTDTKPTEPKADANAEGGKTAGPKARPKKPADGDKPN